MSQYNFRKLVLISLLYNLTRYLEISGACLEISGGCLDISGAGLEISGAYIEISKGLA
jgi:hypothetical protein